MVRILAPSASFRRIEGGVTLQRPFPGCGNFGQQNLRISDSQLL